MIIDWTAVAAIATFFLALATVWLGCEAKKSAKAAEKSITLQQELYEKDNTPMLVFDFDFSGIRNLLCMAAQL